MELNLQQRRKALLVKIPDIEQTLSVVEFLQARREGPAAPGAADDKDETGSMNSDDIDALLDGDDDDEEDAAAGAEPKPLKTLFELNDTLFAEATVQETGEVGLWLGVSGEMIEKPGRPGSAGWGGADTSPGQHDAPVPARRGRRAARGQARVRPQVARRRRRGPRVDPRAGHRHGGQLCACAQRE